MSIGTNEGQRFRPNDQYPVGRRGGDEEFRERFRKDWEERMITPLNEPDPNPRFDPLRFDCMTLEQIQAFVLELSLYTTRRFGLVEQIEKQIKE